MNVRKPRPLPLRRRVALASLLMGFLLSLVFAAIAVVITEDYEHSIATEILQGQAEDYSLRLANGLTAELPRTHRLSGYRANAAGTPPEYSRLATGIHENIRDDGTHLGVFDTSAGRLIFVIDLSDIEVMEEHLNLFLAGMVVLGTALAGWLGWWFSGVTLRPVGRLVDAVDALPVQPQPSHLSTHTSHDELGRLARAIDAYQSRLVEADSREQAFFADASHELRTPLSVVQGVTEVMLDEPGDDPAHLSRLRRLERGVRDMGNLIEALLGVARRSTLQPDIVDAKRFLDEAAQMALPAISTPADQSRVVVDASGQLQLPRREALLLVSGLLRMLVQQAPEAPVHLTLAGNELLIGTHPVDHSAPANGNDARSDTGHASALLDRLALRLGWQLAYEGATRIRIHLRA